jgi:hypothetical protein
MTATKKFGSHTYDLYSQHTTLSDAKKDMKKAREYGFTRVRYTKTEKLYPGIQIFYFVWADVKSLKNPEQPAYQKGGVVHTRRIK